MATIHHNGGRHARAPVHKPIEKITAAQNNGCRDAFRSCIMNSTFRQKTDWKPGARKKRSARQQDYRFDVKCLRKQIEKVRFFNVISSRQQRPKVPRQRSRIARNISDARRTQRYQRADPRLANSSSRWVQDDQVRTLSHRPAPQGLAPQVFIGSRRNRFNVASHIVLEIVMRCL
jgi:hypothetical protein